MRSLQSIGRIVCCLRVVKLVLVLQILNIQTDWMILKIVNLTRVIAMPMTQKIFLECSFFTNSGGRTSVPSLYAKIMDFLHQELTALKRTYAAVVTISLCWIWLMRNWYVCMIDHQLLPKGLPCLVAAVFINSQLEIMFLMRSHLRLRNDPVSS